MVVVVAAVVSFWVHSFYDFSQPKARVFERQKKVGPISVPRTWALPPRLRVEVPLWGPWKCLPEELPCTYLRTLPLPLKGRKPPLRLEILPVLQALLCLKLRRRRLRTHGFVLMTLWFQRVRRGRYLRYFIMTFFVAVLVQCTLVQLTTTPTLEFFSLCQ